MTMTKTLTIAILLVSAALAACSSSTGGSNEFSGSADAALSKGYQSQCFRCHGPKGEGNGGEYPRIPGDKDTVEAFISQVRTGKGEMPAFSATQIKDSELKADYTWFTTVRGK